MHHLMIITVHQTGHRPAVLAAVVCLCSPAAPAGPLGSIVARRSRLVTPQSCSQMIADLIGGEEVPR